MTEGIGRLEIASSLWAIQAIAAEPVERAAVKRRLYETGACRRPRPFRGLFHCQTPVTTITLY